MDRDCFKNNSFFELVTKHRYCKKTTEKGEREAILKCGRNLGFTGGVRLDLRGLYSGFCFVSKICSCQVCFSRVKDLWLRNVFPERQMSAQHPNSGD